MKIFPVFLILAILTGCHKPGLDVTVQQSWKTDPLNGEYTIQFPAGYEGNGMVGFEGPTFSKNRIDKQITFNYFFCGPLSCSPYGEPLTVPFATPYPSSIVQAGTTLDKTVSFKQSGRIQAVFYFAEQARTQGVLYLREIKGGLLRESLNVSYAYDQQAEVLSILQTIQPK